MDLHERNKLVRHDFRRMYRLQQRDNWGFWKEFGFHMLVAGLPCFALVFIAAYMLGIL